MRGVEAPADCSDRMAGLNAEETQQNPAIHREQRNEGTAQIEPEYKLSNDQADGA